MRRVPRVGLLLAHYHRPHLRRIPHPQFVAQFGQHGLEPLRVSRGFDPPAPPPHQRAIKSPRLSVLVLQTALHDFAGIAVQHRNLLVACMQITSYNHHRSAPFLRALVALSASKSTRSLGADTVISSGSKLPRTRSSAASKTCPGMGVVNEGRRW